MFVKVYRYRIRPERRAEFLSIQQLVGRVYSRYVRYRAVFLADVEDGERWMEIHWYEDESSYRESVDLINSDPEIEGLWRRFQALLHPGDRGVEESCYIEVLEDDNMTDGSGGGESEDSPGPADDRDETRSES